MAKTYYAWDIKTGMKVGQVDNVADPVLLTGVGLASGQAGMSFAALPAGVTLWPGMPVVCKGVPVGTTVLSVDGPESATLSANATGNASDVWAMCLSLDCGEQTQSFAAGTYRDIFQVSPGSEYGVDLQKAGWYYDSYTVNESGTVGADPQATQSDDVSHTAPRNLTELWSVNRFICADGQQVMVPVNGSVRWAPYLE